MKKVLILLTISIAAFGQRISPTNPAYMIKNEQVVRFTTNAYQSQIDKFIDSALTLTKNKYQLLKSSDSTAKKEYFKTYTSGDEKTLIFKYDISMEGANVDLEVKGDKFYNLSYISGPYLDVFPIWQKYIAKTADLMAVQEKGTDIRFISNGHNFFFEKRHPIWVISYRLH